jgi:diguanylate cyclase (GGDEF)-like protein
MDYGRLKNKILLLFLLLTLFLIGVILTVQYKIERSTTKDMINLEKERFQDVYNYSIDNFYLMYSSIGLKIVNNPEVALAVKNRDKDKLLLLSKDIYEQLKIENLYFYNMHFHTKDSVSIARLHKPGKYGDDLKGSRPMIVAVNKQKKILHGVEVGKHVISFRVAFPVFYKSEHVGSLELGVKIDYLTNLLKEEFKTGSFFVFHNKILGPLFKYSKGKLNFRTIENISLFYYENCALPEKFSFKELDNVLHDKGLFELERSNIYFSEISTLKDYKNQPIGHIVFAIDMNKFMDKVDFYRSTIILSFLIFGIILFVMLFYWFNFFVKEVMKNQFRLKELSMIDELTKLYNRRKIIELIDCEYDRSKRYKINDTLILFDIDFFKNINDTYGHNIGDNVLKELAKLLKMNIRKTDHLGRWGGEEFLIVATETDLGSALTFTENLRYKIENHEFKEVGKVTCSFGVARLNTEYDYKDSIHNADLALYEAKQQGRNKVVVYKSDT